MNQETMDLRVSFGAGSERWLEKCGADVVRHVLDLVAAVDPALSPDTLPCVPIGAMGLSREVKITIGLQVAAVLVGIAQLWATLKDPAGSKITSEWVAAHRAEIEAVMAESDAVMGRNEHLVRVVTEVSEAATNKYNVSVTVSLMD